MPNLFGATEENARDLLLNAGLRVGEVTKAETKPFTVNDHLREAKQLLGQLERVRGKIAAHQRSEGDGAHDWSF